MRASVDFPQPDSPTRPRDLAARHRERDAVHRVEHPLRAEQPAADGEVAPHFGQLDQRAGHAGRRQRFACPGARLGERLVRLAPGTHVRAAIAELAAVQLADRRRHLAWDHPERFARPRAAGNRDAGEQPARVRVQRRREQRRHRRALDDLARVHHRDAIGDARDDAEIVRDQDERHPELALQRLQQVQDLRLDRDVERGGRLVGDDQRRLAHQRHRDHHALAQPPES